MTRCVLETRGLVKRFEWGGSTQMSVDHISLHVDEGKVYGLLGSNDAGKSTTLKMIAGMLHPTKGHGPHQAAHVTDGTHALHACMAWLQAWRRHCPAALPSPLTRTLP